jgi:hypothetical protein
MVLHFPPKGPTQSQVNNPTNTNCTREEQILNLARRSLHSTSTAIDHLSISLLTVSHKEIGLTRINRKVVDVSYGAPQAHGIINVALHREYSPGIIFIFSHGRKDLYHV